MKDIKIIQATLLRTKLLQGKKKQFLERDVKMQTKTHRWLLQKQPECITVSSTVIHTDHLTERAN